MGAVLNKSSPFVSCLISTHKQSSVSPPNTRKFPKKNTKNKCTCFAEKRKNYTEHNKCTFFTPLHERNTLRSVMWKVVVTCTEALLFENHMARIVCIQYVLSVTSLQLCAQWGTSSVHVFKALFRRSRWILWCDSCLLFSLFIAPALFWTCTNRHTLPLSTWKSCGQCCLLVYSFTKHLQPYERVSIRPYIVVMCSACRRACKSCSRAQSY